MHSTMSNKLHCRLLSRSGIGLCLTLMVSVFAWGLGYKLDQYSPPHRAAHDLPKAKFVSRNEQTWAADAAQNVSIPRAKVASTVPPSFLFHAILAQFSAQNPFSTRLAPSSERLSRPPLLVLNHLFVRPPPTRA